MSENGNPLDHPLLDSLLKLSEEIKEVKIAQLHGESQRIHLSMALESHMQTEEKIQTEIMSVVSDLRESIKNLDSHEHVKHHEYMDDMIAEQRARKEFWCGVKANIATGTIWATLGGLVTVIGYAIKQFITTTQG